MVYFALILNLKFYEKIIKSDDQNDADSLPQTMLTRKRKKQLNILKDRHRRNSSEMHRRGTRAKLLPSLSRAFIS